MRRLLVFLLPFLLYGIDWPFLTQRDDCSNESDVAG
jgi:hypothetical protein